MSGCIAAVLCDVNFLEHTGTILCFLIQENKAVMSNLTSKLGQLAPNGTNLGLFKIIFFILAGYVPDLSI